MESVERVEREKSEGERIENKTLESKVNEMERIINEKFENKINELEIVMNEKFENKINELEIVMNEKFENKINEMERIMNEKLEREKSKNESLESKINEMERIILNLTNIKSNKETEFNIINKSRNKNLDEKGKEKTNEKQIINKEESNEKGKEESKEESNVIVNEKGDLAVVLYNFIANTSDELTLYKNEYLIITNWNVDDGYSFGYKRNDPQKKGKFPTPLVRKYSEKNKGLSIFFFF